MPDPPNSSGTVMPSSPSSPSLSQRSAGNSLLLSISAARGAISSAANRCTVSRNRSRSSLIWVLKALIGLLCSCLARNGRLIADRFPGARCQVQDIAVVCGFRPSRRSLNLFVYGILVAAIASIRSIARRSAACQLGIPSRSAIWKILPMMW